MEHRLNGEFGMGGGLSGFMQLAQLNLGHHAQDVVFALEVVEEGSLAYVRGFRDVFDGDIGKTALGKELEGGAKEAEAGVRGAARTASDGGRVGLKVRCKGQDGGSCNFWMTLAHTRPWFIFDHWSYLYV